MRNRTGEVFCPKPVEVCFQLEEKLSDLSLFSHLGLISSSLLHITYSSKAAFIYEYL